MRPRLTLRALPPANGSTLIPNCNRKDWLPPMQLALPPRNGLSPPTERTMERGKRMNRLDVGGQRVEHAPTRRVPVVARHASDRVDASGDVVVRVLQRVDAEALGVVGLEQPPQLAAERAAPHDAGSQLNSEDALDHDGDALCLDCAAPGALLARGRAGVARWTCTGAVRSARRLRCFYFSLLGIMI